jgi:hypothetical protein
MNGDAVQYAKLKEHCICIVGWYAIQGALTPALSRKEREGKALCHIYVGRVKLKV